MLSGRRLTASMSLIVKRLNKNIDCLWLITFFQIDCGIARFCVLSARVSCYYYPNESAREQRVYRRRARSIAAKKKPRRRHAVIRSLSGLSLLNGKKKGAAAVTAAAAAAAVMIDGGTRSDVPISTDKTCQQYVVRFSLRVSAAVPSTLPPRWCSRLPGRCKISIRSLVFCTYRVAREMSRWAKCNFSTTVRDCLYQNFRICTGKIFEQFSKISPKHFSASKIRFYNILFSISKLGWKMDIHHHRHRRRHHHHYHHHRHHQGLSRTHTARVGYIRA